MITKKKLKTLITENSQITIINDKMHSRLIAR